MHEEEKNEGSIFSELFVDRERPDLNQLLRIAKPFLRLDGVSKRVIHTKAWSALNNPSKILTHLIGMKILHIEGVVDIEGLTATEIGDATGINSNSVRPTLGRLLDANMVTTDADKRYFVPNYQMNAIEEDLK